MTMYCKLSHGGGRIVEYKLLQSFLSRISGIFPCTLCLKPTTFKLHSFLNAQLYGPSHNFKDFSSYFDADYTDYLL